MRSLGHNGVGLTLSRFWSSHVELTRVAGGLFNGKKKKIFPQGDSSGQTQVPNLVWNALSLRPSGPLGLSWLWRQPQAGGLAQTWVAHARRLQAPRNPPCLSPPGLQTLLSQGISSCLQPRKNYRSRSPSNLPTLTGQNSNCNLKKGDN